jgi:xylan 1,4-beta-xylosidase
MPHYTNPVLPGFYPDPSVCRVGSDYYLVTSSFTYFPGVPLFHSRDLVHWRQLGHCLTRPEQVPLAQTPSWAGIWAPTLRYRDGVFYMTTTNMPSGGNFIVTASRPEGPWSDPIPVAQPGIDPSLFFDEDGTVFYTTSHDGALQSRIDIASGRLLTEPKVVWGGTGGQHPEGPHLYRHQGWYYLLLSEGGTEYGHMITMARSKSAWGPFEPCSRNPLLTHRSAKSPIQGIGHADLVDTPDGSWFAVALGFRPVGYPPCYHLGRETFLAPVRWSSDGFPVLGADGRLALEQAVPPEHAMPPLEPASAPARRDDFDADELAPCWNYLRNPEPSLYSLGERRGHLRLRGSAQGLDDVASPAWLGRRQCHFSVRVAAQLEFGPTTEREEAGLVVRMNEQHHYEVFVTLRDRVPSVVVRRRIGSLQAEVASRPLPPGASRYVLAIDADSAKYTFFFGRSDGELEPFAEGEARYLSTEVAGGFTGAYFALYASGNGAPCVGPADFDWFDYLPREAPAATP